MGDTQNGSMPISMQMALAHNVQALQAFLKLDDAAQDKIIEKARQTSSKRELQKIIDSMPEETGGFLH